jgi:hypothetical protein
MYYGMARAPWEVSGQRIFSKVAISQQKNLPVFIATTLLLRFQ